MSRLPILLVAAAFATSAQASDQKHYSGTFCQSKSTANPITYGDGAAYNKNASSLAIDCAVARDLSSSSSVTMYIIDNHYSANATCYISSVQVGTWTGWWSGPLPTSGSNPMPQALSLGSVGGDSTSWLHVTCNLPASYYGNYSGVQAYTVNES